MHTLDIETAPNETTDNPYALEPYRVKTGQSRITSIAISNGKDITQYYDGQGDFRQSVTMALTALAGEEVYAHNAVFDVAFLIATFGIDVVRNIKWRDSMLLAKYLCNGQKAEEARTSYSLKACIERWCDDHPDYEEFLAVKDETHAAGEDTEYWLKRGRMDADLTHHLVEFLTSKLDDDIRTGFVVTCAAIVPIAEGWVQGIPVDFNRLDKYVKDTQSKMEEIIKEVGVPGTMMTSAKQLGGLLYDKWELPVLKRTPKGSPSTDKETFIRLCLEYPDHEKLQLIRKYRTMNTMMSKYVGGFERSRAYLQQDIIHGQPRILATKTGRMTYASKYFKKDKYQTAIALHQIPRKETEIKACMVAPPGYKVLYLDVSAQEGRFMAIVAPEPTMIKGYNEGLDLHSVLTEEIFGTPYDSVVLANDTGEPKETVEQRQAGKLTGLSSFYRIGAKALARKFLETYEFVITQSTAFSYLNSFKRRYPGVVKFWQESIGLARRNGYAEAIGGWRYRISKLDWMGESNAINHRIQGSAAIQTYATMGVIHKKWPECILVTQVHDALIYFVPEAESTQTAIELKRYMDAYNYGDLIGFNQTVPIILDVALGNNFGELTNVTKMKEWNDE